MGQKRALIWPSRRPLSVVVRWSQLIDATLYLRGKDGVCRWIRDFVEDLLRQKRQSCGIAGSGATSRRLGGLLVSPRRLFAIKSAPHGGIRPASRRRSQLALTLPEREEISRGLASHQSARSIARLLGRSASTVSRELRRNGGYDRYRAAPADEQAWARSRRPKRCKLAISPWLRRAVTRKLRLNWSPEQIGGWLKRSHPGDEVHPVHQTIYRSLFVQARGVLKKKKKCWATASTICRSQRST